MLNLAGRWRLVVVHGDHLNYLPDYLSVENDVSVTIFFCLHELFWKDRWIGEKEKERGEKRQSKKKADKFSVRGFVHIEAEDRIKEELND